MLANTLKIYAKVGFPPSFAFLTFAIVAVSDLIGYAIGTPVRFGIPLAVCAAVAVAIDFPHRSSAAASASVVGAAAATVVLWGYSPARVLSQLTLVLVWLPVALAMVHFVLAPAVRSLQDKYPRPPVRNDPNRLAG